MSNTPDNNNFPQFEDYPIFKFFTGLFDRHNRLFKLVMTKELYSFIFGFLALILLALYYFALRMSSAESANHLWKIIGYHISGGAAFGVLKGAGYGDLTIRDNIICNFLITTTIIMFFNTLFSLSCSKVMHFKFLEKAFKDLTSEANSQKKTWVKFGIPGVFAFVFFPMTGTGPIIGSVIAKLIGMGFWTNILTVLGGSITSIVTFAFAADRISNLIGDKTLSRIAFSLIVLLIITAGYVKFRAWLQQRKSSIPAPSSQADNADSDGPSENP